MELNGKIICGHVLDVLKEIPDNSIDCIITSPPYWGLRKYPDSANVVWGGDPNCEHEWETVETKRPNLSGGKDNDYVKEKLAIKGTENYKEQVDYHKRVTASAFCKKCGAWYGQLGLEPTLDMYLDHLLEITAELKRVLKPTGILFWNHGDCYGGTGTGHKASHYPEGHKLRFKGTTPESWYADLKKSDVKQKCMAMQNFRLALRMIDEQGWILRNVIIWYKPNHLPESVKDRFTKAYEPIFMFVKKKKYYFNLDAVRVPLKSVKDKRLNEHNFVNPVEMGYNSKHKGKDISPFKTKFSFNYRVREAKKGHFGILGVRASKEEMEKYDKQGRLINSKYPDWEEIKDEKESELTLGGFGRFWAWERKVGRKALLGKNPGDVWEITTEPFPEAHFATFPLKLVVRCLVAGCPPDGIVLDPFMGSGTVALACELLNHKMWDKIPKFEEICNAEVVKSINWNLKWTGIEIVKDYVEMTKRRIENVIFKQAKSLTYFID